MIRFTLLLLGLSILITLHEFGHYITARWFKTRVEKFYLFFDFLFPFPNILPFSLFKKKIGDTEYGLGWFPFGGYVKIAGMIDESMDEGFLNSPPQPWEFRSKPAWQRLIIMLGGVIVNLILGFFIFAMLLWTNGETSIPMKNATYGFVADSLAQSIGLKTGDKLIGYNNQVVFEDASVSVVKDLLLDNASSLQIERDGQAMSLQIPESVYQSIIDGEGKVPFVKLAFPSVIDTFAPTSPLRNVLHRGDKIVFMNNTPIQYFAEIGIELNKHINEEMLVGIQRGNDTIVAKIKVPKDGLLKIQATDITEYFKTDTVSYSLLASFPAGVKHSFGILNDYVKQFRIIFVMGGWKQIGGFGTIAKVYPETWNWSAFWASTALLSLILAFMNVLPIPALDGGHALFTIYEMVTGKAPSDKFLERAQMVGMVFVFSLLIYANGNDIVRFVKSLLQ